MMTVMPLIDTTHNSALHLRCDLPLPQRILVVEDDRIQWPLWRHILKTVYGNAEIEWQSTEAEAEKLLNEAALQNRPFDLVISDIFLKGRDSGIELWNRCGQAATHFVFVSSLSFPNFMALMRSRGHQEIQSLYYLQKPVTTKMGRELLERLGCEEDQH